MQKKIDPMVKKRYVEQMLDRVPDYPHPTAAAQVVAERIGKGAERARRWYLQAQPDSDQRQGLLHG